MIVAGPKIPGTCIVFRGDAVRHAQRGLPPARRRGPARRRRHGGRPSLAGARAGRRAQARPPAAQPRHLARGAGASPRPSIRRTSRRRSRTFAASRPIRAPRRSRRRFLTAAGRGVERSVHARGARAVRQPLQSGVPRQGRRLRPARDRARDVPRCGRAGPARRQGGADRAASARSGQQPRRRRGAARDVAGESPGDRRVVRRRRCIAPASRTWSGATRSARAATRT